MTTAAPAGSLGAYIRRKRKAAELTQEELAARVGTTQGGISNWEASGIVPSPKALAALARVLPGASVDEMLELIERQDGAA